MAKEAREEVRRREKEKGRKERRNLLLLKEELCQPVMLSRNSVPWMIRTVAGILGATFWVTLEVDLNVCL